ncbi:hypothetical protein HU200_009425 [Digitaria exilis]|uniref:Uncharacterized protein n=1 Tax=Digitaria exilis TaxID=1010633 RepID=A0A835FJU6_9POAL|nr:hypothetical protein HU200_009425 [Digitaria exilis]
MVPITSNLLHHDSKSLSSYKPCFHPRQYCVGIAAQLEASSAAAARQEHRNRPAMADDDEPAAAAAGTTASSSRGSGAGAGDDDGDWLQLCLSGGGAAASSSSGDNHSMDPAAPPPPMELDLFTYDDDNRRNARMMMRPPPLFPLPLRSYHHQSSFGRGRHRPPAAPTTSPFMPPFIIKNSGDAIRVIGPPRRTAAGLWLKLEAAPNQVREPILPQIPKSYLRIKDSNIKVEVVVKYVAEKLGISSRSHQVELTCRGQLLPPFLLVKHVRDTIWCSTAPPEETLADLTPSLRTPAAAPTDHVMTLCYSTIRNSKLVLDL